MVPNVVSDSSIEVLIGVLESELARVWMGPHTAVRSQANGNCDLLNGGCQMWEVVNECYREVPLRVSNKVPHSRWEMMVQRLRNLQHVKDHLPKPIVSPKVYGWAIAHLPPQVFEDLHGKWSYPSPKRIFNVVPNRVLVLEVTHFEVHCPLSIGGDAIPTQLENSCLIYFSDWTKTKSLLLERQADFVPGYGDQFTDMNIPRPYEILNPTIDFAK